VLRDRAGEDNGFWENRGKNDTSGLCSQPFDLHFVFGVRTLSIVSGKKLTIKFVILRLDRLKKLC